MMRMFWTMLMAAGIPTAVTAFCFWVIENRISRRQKKDDEERKRRQAYVDEKEEKREELLYLLIQSVNASIALSEATARAVERIPDAHCNGDMRKALDYATDVKHKQKEFITREGIKNIFEDIA